MPFDLPDKSTDERGEIEPRGQRKEERMNDIEITNHGSIFLFAPKTQAGREFVADAPEDAMYWGLALVVEHRYANDVAIAAINQGLSVC